MKGNPWKPSALVAILLLGPAAVSNVVANNEPQNPPATLLAQPFSLLIREALKAAGLSLPPGVEAELEAFGASLDDAFSSALEEAPMPIPMGDIGVEVCNGQGTCGGKYVDNRSYQFYYDNHANTTNNVCSGNTVYLNVHLGSGNYCYAVTDNKVCVVSECHEPESVIQPNVDRFSSLADTGRMRNPSVYVGVRVCVPALEPCPFQNPG